MNRVPTTLTHTDHTDKTKLLHKAFDAILCEVAVVEDDGDDDCGSEECSREGNTRREVSDTLSGPECLAQHLCDFQARPTFFTTIHHIIVSVLETTLSADIKQVICPRFSVFAEEEGFWCGTVVSWHSNFVSILHANPLSVDDLVPIQRRCHWSEAMLAGGCYVRQCWLWSCPASAR